MGRKLILLFDGTWNNSKDKTNVYRMKEAIDSTGENDPRQPFMYDPGVGTRWYDRFTGGAFGRGLSANIRQGYQWLARERQDGDDIYLFGFSRGAYTARSLAGMIRKCGILGSPDPALVEKAYDLYRDKAVAPDDGGAVSFRSSHSRETRIKFIGVWDTVGALGIPVSHVPFSRDYYRWHDTRLSKIVDYGYHAVAVDENRKDYAVTIWTRNESAKNIDIEQRWFVGAHANVGGGYDKSPPDTLPNLPLRWIQDKAEATGLKLRQATEVADRDHLADVNDSFSEFMFGVYKVFQDRYTRPIGKGVNETVDGSVWDRYRKMRSYRPKSLRGHPDKPAG